MPLRRRHLGIVKKNGTGATSGADVEGATFFAGARAAASVMFLATRLPLEVLDWLMRVTWGDSCLQAHAPLPQRRVWAQTQNMSARRVAHVPPDDATSLPSSPQTPRTSRHRCRCCHQTWCAVVFKRLCCCMHGRHSTYQKCIVPIPTYT